MASSEHFTLDAVSIAIDVGNKGSLSYGKLLHVQLSLVKVVLYSIACCQNNIAYTFISVTCRPLVTSLNSFTRLSEPD